MVMETCITGMALIISILLRLFAGKFQILFIVLRAFTSILTVLFQNLTITIRTNVWFLCKTNLANL